MDILKNYLPKDLVNIVEEYAKDRTHFDLMLKHLEEMIRKINSAHWPVCWYDHHFTKSIIKLIKYQNHIIAQEKKYKKKHSKAYAELLLFN